MDTAGSKEGRLQFLVMAVLILLLPFGWYYFVYVSSEKAYLIDRNFRLLGLTGQEIQARIEFLSLSWNQMTEEFSKSVAEESTETLEMFQKKAQGSATELINLISGLEKNSTKVEFQAETSENSFAPSFQVERKQAVVTASFHYQRSIKFLALENKKCEDAKRPNGGE